MDRGRILIRLFLVCLIEEVLTEEKPCTKLGKQQICNEEIQDAFNFSLHYVTNKIKYLTEFRKIDQITKPWSTDINLFRHRLKDAFVHILETQQEPFEIVSDILIDNYDISDEEKGYVLPKLKFEGMYSNYTEFHCKSIIPDPECDPHYPYRSYTGECNNLGCTTWGSIMTCYDRLLPAHYVGASDFRLGKDGKPLPDPRTLSLNIHQHVNRTWNNFNHMYVFFGQLLGHDITMTPMTTLRTNEAIQCCPKWINNHPQCAPLSISVNDPFYSKYDVNCLNFVRSSICPTCKLGVREQMNQVTSYIDASFIYGNTKEKIITLRKYGDTGRLGTEKSNFGYFLPRTFNNTIPEDICFNRNGSRYCFVTGDTRANQHTVLAMLHTIFIREHNRIAKHLIYINPKWNKKQIFRVARKIVGAEMQMITYNEYLPITIGKKYTEYYILNVKSKGYSQYDSKINPSLYTEFATAAFRFGHTLINSSIMNVKNSVKQKQLLRDNFYHPSVIYNDTMIEKYLLNAIQSPSQFYDPNLVPDVTNYLYRIKGQEFGLDLAAFNIQRGRDHGLPPYTRMLKACLRKPVEIKNFEDLTYKKLMSKTQVDILKKNYRHVDDIDMWTGILSESPMHGSAVGPTAACIIGLQFYKLKFGDRFYFEHGNQAGSFTPDQLKELRKVTLSSLICQNTKLTVLPFWAMLGTRKKNSTIKCKDIPTIDFTPWKE